MMNHNRPYIGVGILLFHEKTDKVLLGQRRTSHGAGTWGPPGGHLEHGESWESCAIRELYEETGITITQAVFAAVTNDIFVNEHKHYVSIFMQSICPNEQVARICEPDKIVTWQWFSLNQLPEPLFLPLDNLIKLKDGSRSYTHIEQSLLKKIAAISDEMVQQIIVASKSQQKGENDAK